MASREETRARILETARDLVQTLGYNGVGFEDIAERIGLDTRELESHFPTKAELGAAVAALYRDEFMQRLRTAEAEAGDALDALQRYAGLFRSALVDDGRMCLCGLLGTEVTSLPREVADEVRRFFECNLAWLAQTLNRGQARDEVYLSSPAETEANLLMAVLEGAMVIARSTERYENFDESVEAALRRYRSEA